MNSSSGSTPNRASRRLSVGRNGTTWGPGHIPHPHHSHPHHRAMLAGEGVAPVVNSTHWSSDETILLIRAWGELREEFAEIKRNHSVWNKVVDKLISRGFFRTVDQCRNRWKFLESKYKAAKKDIRQTGKKPIWEFFNEMLSAKNEEYPQVCDEPNFRSTESPHPTSQPSAGGSSSHHKRPLSLVDDFHGGPKFGLNGAAGEAGGGPYGSPSRISSPGHSHTPIPPSQPVNPNSIQLPSFRSTFVNDGPGPHLSPPHSYQKPQPPPSSGNSIPPPSGHQGSNPGGGELSAQGGHHYNRHTSPPAVNSITPEMTRARYDHHNHHHSRERDGEHRYAKRHRVGEYDQEYTESRPPATYDRPNGTSSPSYYMAPTPRSNHGHFYNEHVGGQSLHDRSPLVNEPNVPTGNGSVKGPPPHSHHNSSVPRPGIDTGVDNRGYHHHYHHHHSMSRDHHHSHKTADLETLLQVYLEDPKSEPLSKPQLLAFLSKMSRIREDRESMRARERLEYERQRNIEEQRYHEFQVQLMSMVSRHLAPGILDADYRVGSHSDSQEKPKLNGHSNGPSASSTSSSARHSPKLPKNNSNNRSLEISASDNHRNERSVSNSPHSHTQRKAIEERHANDRYYRQGDRLSSLASAAAATTTTVTNGNENNPTRSHTHEGSGYNHGPNSIPNSPSSRPVTVDAVDYRDEKESSRLLALSTSSYSNSSSQKPRNNHGDENSGKSSSPSPLVSAKQSP
ncbi:hypothetical protein H4219_005626 [Mycoemilia scoparia]|uniref:Myb-like domain-containing protein n=1 Tax=Mycoemilia scoparia TaxID=417184 RepID=A0A9W8DPQ6_9FUNG|nr:hypothetical protein H4219_005626 [Mycoemilia scoparia]